MAIATEAFKSRQILGFRLPGRSLVATERPVVTTPIAQNREVQVPPALQRMRDIYVAQQNGTLVTDSSGIILGIKPR